MKHFLLALAWFAIACLELSYCRTWAPWFWWALIATGLNLKKLGREPAR